MKTSASCAVAISAVLLGSTGALAQEAPAATAMTQKEAASLAQPFASASADLAPQGTDASSPVSSLHGFSLTGTQDTTNASVRLGWVINSFASGLRSNPRGDIDTGTIILSTPISKTTDFTNLSTLDGLANSSKVTFQWTHTIVHGFVDWGEAGDHGAICAKLRKTLEPATTDGALLRTVFNSAIDKLFAKVDESQRPYLKEPGPNNAYCDATTINAILGKAEAEAFDSAADAKLTSVGPATLFGLLGTAARQDYTYFAPVTLASQTLQRSPWQAGGFVSLLGAGKKWSLLAEYQYGDSFKETPVSVACLSGAGPVLKCINGSIGRPSETQKDLFSAEGRWIFKLSSMNFGVAPQATYDAHSGVYGFGLPIYLFGDDKNALTGGVRADWTSDKHQIIAGVFLTKGFSITGTPN